MGSRCSSLARARRPIIHPSPRRAHRRCIGSRQPCRGMQPRIFRHLPHSLSRSTPPHAPLASQTKQRKHHNLFFLFTPSQEEKSRVDGDTCQPNRTDPSSMVPRFGIYCSLARGRRITLFSVRFTKVLLSSTDRRKKGGKREKINPQNRARERTRPSRFYAACHLLRACISWISLNEQRQTNNG